MTPKQEAALRQALEAMNLARAAHGQVLLSDPPQEAWKAWGVSAALTKAMTAASEALAEQPAQPCGYPYCGCNSKAWCKAEQQSGIKQVIELYDSPEQPAQQEPVATLDDIQQEIYENTREFVSLNVMEWMLKRYYTPPASKPWVGLTPAEAGALWKVGMTPHEFSCAIEAKLKEKNT